MLVAVWATIVQSEFDHKCWFLPGNTSLQVVGLELPKWVVRDCQAPACLKVQVLRGPGLLSYWPADHWQRPCNEGPWFTLGSPLFDHTVEKRTD
jgi:hypothetical protein